MNAEHIQINGSKEGNWIAFTFGAIFNLLSNVRLDMVIEYAIQAAVGGIVVLLFKFAGDLLQSYWKQRKRARRRARKKLDEHRDTEYDDGN